MAYAIKLCFACVGLGKVPSGRSSGKIVLIGFLLTWSMAAGSALISYFVLSLVFGFIIHEEVNFGKLFDQSFSFDFHARMRYTIS